MCKMKEEELEALKLNYKKIVETIFVDELMPGLYEKGLIRSHDTMERIQSEKTTTDKACKLMQRVMKCDKPSAFQDFVSIVEEYYEFLAEELNQSVTKLRRQKRCLRKLKPEEPKRHHGTGGTMEDDDDVFTDIPNEHGTAQTLPKYPATKPVCHLCKRRVRSEISSEAGMPTLCYYGRYNKKNHRTSHFSSSSDTPYISQSSSNDEAELPHFGDQRTEDDRLCKIFDFERSVQSRSVNSTQTQVKIPFTTLVDTEVLLGTSETLLKEKVSTTLSVSPRQPEQNTDMHGLSVNYGDIGGCGDNINSHNIHNNDLSSTSCQCAGFLTNPEFQKRFNQDIPHVEGSSEVGEDVPDSYVSGFVKDELHTGAGVRLSEIHDSKSNNIELTPIDRVSGSQVGCTLHCAADSEPRGNCDKVSETGLVKTEAGEVDTPPSHQPSDSACTRSESLRRIGASNKKQRQAVVFNVSQDEVNESELKESHWRHATLSRKDCNESFGFKYVCGKKRPRHKDDEDYYISDVLPDSLAASCSDIRVMYSIVSVNGQPLHSKTLDDIQKLFESSLTVSLTLKPYGVNSQRVTSYTA